MHKFAKKLTIVAMAAVTAFGMASVSGCSNFTPPEGDYSSGEVVSNGGFVVEKGNYVYFINGVASYSEDNTYGDVVKGALMRISKSDLALGKNTAETVVPSLMVAGDHTSGIYVYGDRVYYATPNNVKNTSGVIESDYLDYKSAKLDGSDVVSYFRVSDNSTVYRYVQVDGTVYLMYAESKTLNSYNTATRTNTILAKETTSYAFNSADVEDPAVYYTMGVSAALDSDSPIALSYNQIYKATADTTASPYTYVYDQAYLDENDGNEPYTNLGTIVLDGIGSTGLDTQTQFTHDVDENNQPLTSGGYTYALTSYNNGGIYFTRTDITKTSSTGETGWLYYLSASKLGEGWNSVTGNEANNLTIIAKSTAKASSSAVYYIDEQSVHHYVYVDGKEIVRADVGDNGVATTQRIARNVSGATLMTLDTSSDEEYDYLYFTRTNGSGLSVERAVVNGTEENYSNLSKNDNYQPVKVLDLQHASDWYNYEIIDGTVYIADAEALGSTSYNYISAVSIKNANGSLKTNSELVALNDRYEAVTDYFAEVAEDHADLSTLIKCYFYTETTKYYDDNLAAAAEAGKSEEYLYNAEDKQAFADFVDGKGDGVPAEDRVRSAFILRIGAMKEADQEAYDTYWSNLLEHYTPPTVEDEGLPVWAWVLIGVGIAIVVAAAVLVPVLLSVRKKKLAAAEPKKEKLVVDTTDDKSVDVYADEPQEEAPEAIVEEIVGDPVEAEVSEPAEAEVSEEPATEENKD